MSKKTPTISLNDLSTGYFSKGDSIFVSRLMNASLFPGEMTCLLGQNGAGKSTLLKTLTGFISPLEGEIKIMDKSLLQFSASELSKTIGVVLTEKPDLVNMSVFELVSLGRSPYTGFWGKMSRKDKEIVNESISLVGISSFKDRMIQTLSDGERQKVMIAKTLAQQTPVIFLDEPTAFLDYPSKVEIMQLLHDLAINKGKTIFLSTHDLELALQTADKIWLLDKIHGLTVGTPEDLSLNNSLGLYFEREGISFDNSSGSFKIIHTSSHSVNLSGTGPEYNLAAKALARKGIEVNPHFNSDIRIIADKNGFKVNDLEASSIERMLEIVEEKLGCKV